MALSVQRILIKLFAIDVKGGGKATKGFYKTIIGRVLPSMPKGEIVGNIVIDGKGCEQRNWHLNVSRGRTEKELRQAVN